MRSMLASLSQLAVMAAIVATIVYVPIGVLLGVGLHLAGVPWQSLATFGGALGLFLGLVAWWVLVFAGACGYAAWAFPWDDKVFDWRIPK